MKQSTNVLKLNKVNNLIKVNPVNNIIFASLSPFKLDRWKQGLGSYAQLSHIKNFPSLIRRVGASQARGAFPGPWIAGIKWCAGNQ